MKVNLAKDVISWKVGRCLQSCEKSKGTGEFVLRVRMYGYNVVDGNKTEAGIVQYNDGFLVDTLFVVFLLELTTVVAYLLYSQLTSQVTLYLLVSPTVRILCRWFDIVNCNATFPVRSPEDSRLMWLKNVFLKTLIEWKVNLFETLASEKSGWKIRLKKRKLLQNFRIALISINKSY